MDTKWYVIRSVTGKEKQATEQIQAEIRNNGYDEYVKQVIMPLEKVYHLRNGKKVATERNHYPGYILIEMHPNILGEIKSLFKKINFVAGFLGDDKPICLRQTEVNRILGIMDELEHADEVMTEMYIVGEKVKIIDGAFTTFIGQIFDVNKEKKRIKMSVKIFGRETPIELKFEQVSKELA